MSESNERVAVSVDDLGTMFICMVRYSLGRSTYVTSDCSLLYDKFRHKLTHFQKRILARDISEDLKRAEARGEFLGMRTDHEGWRQLLAEIESDLRTANLDQKEP